MLAEWVTERRAPLGNRLAGVLGRCASLGTKTAIALGWRATAAGAGLLLAGWLAAAVPGLLDAPVNENAPTSPVATGSISPEITQRLTPDWVAISRPTTVFSLAALDAAGQPWRLSARLDQRSSLREDRFVAGAFGEDRFFADIIFQRHALMTGGTLALGMSRALSQEGLALVRSSQPTGLVTKFGATEAADVVVADGARERACLAFRHVAEPAGFLMQGLVCGHARPADRVALACMIDRITLLGAGDDRELRSHFSRAELQRLSGCTPPRLEAAGRRVTWLDNEGAAPRLRR